MASTILNSIITYFATCIDEIPILFLLYTRKSNHGKARIITEMYFLGTFLLVAAGILGALGLGFFIQQEILGLLGLVPIFLGIRILLNGEDDDELEEAEEALKKNRSLRMQILSITL